MSTRATIVINNSDGERVIAIYKHCDGYIHGGLGAEIFRFMSKRDLVNGIPFGTENTGKVWVNGLGDLAAQLVVQLKGSADNYGGVYIMENNEEIHGDVEYIYNITPSNSLLCPPKKCPHCGQNITTSSWKIEVIRHDASIFTGTPDEALVYFGRNKNKPL